MFTKKKLLLQLELENKFLFQITSDELDHTYLIGRDRMCDWQIPATDRSASNRHAELFVRRGKVYIRDLNSHNGVFFLGEKITERPLAPGERYGIGDSVLVVSKIEENKTGKLQRKYHRLEQLNGKNRKKTYDLSEKEYILGSAYDADIRCEDTMISQHHAKLEIKDDGSCWLIDLGSRNGTSVNHMVLSAENAEGRMLQHGDIISIVCLDFTFYDKTVPIQKSYFLLKTVCAVLTVLIVLAVYFFWQSLMPSAKDYIEGARNLAEVKKFDKALSLLTKVSNAPKAEVYKQEYSDLRKQIESWKSTTEKWDQTQNLISRRKWISANKILVGLVSTRSDIWNWNDSDAVENKRLAQITAQVLDAFLHSRILMAQHKTPIPVLESACLRLQKSLSCIANYKYDFLVMLYKEGQFIAEELQYMIVQKKKIDGIVSQLNSDKDLKMSLQLMKTIRGDIALRNKNVIQKRRRVNHKQVLEYCDTYLGPLQILSVGQEEFLNNKKLIATLEIEKVQKNLTLPTPEESAVSPVFTIIRSQLTTRNEILSAKSKQLSVLISSLASSGIALKKQPEILKKWHKNSYLDNVIKCDCFNHPASRWTVKRTVSTGLYDQFLGIEHFWDFLLDLPERYDISLADGRPFVPEIVRIRHIYGELEIFKDFMNDPIIAHLLSLNVSNSKLIDFALWVEDLLIQRNRTIQKLINFSRKTSNKREKLISGSFLCILDNGKMNISKDFYEEMEQLFKSIRRETSSIAEQDATPEQIIKNRRNIIAVGIPGDPVVRQAINEMAEEKK